MKFVGVRKQENDLCTEIELFFKYLKAIIFVCEEDQTELTRLINLDPYHPRLHLRYPKIHLGLKTTSRFCVETLILSLIKNS